MKIVPGLELRLLLREMVSDTRPEVGIWELVLVVVLIGAREGAQSLRPDIRTQDQILLPVVEWLSCSVTAHDIQI